MPVLSYDGTTKEVTFKKINDIRESFSIPSRKNIYMVGESNALEKLDMGNAPKLLKDGAVIEAITDFELG